MRTFERDRSPVRLFAVTEWICLTLLLTVGVFRPQLPDSWRTHWLELVLILAGAAALARVVRTLVLPRKDPYRQVLVTVFYFVLALFFIQPQRVASDGIFYFAPLRSIVVNGDIDFENEYRVLGAPEGYFQRTETGRLPNNFSVGPALLWMPFYLLVHGIAHLGLFRPTGFGYSYFTIVGVATVLGGFAGVCWFFQLARSYFNAPVALAATLLLWLGTFHLWYMAFEPSMSHALAMASVTGFLLLCSRGRRFEGVSGFVLVGAIAGLVVLVRWQNAIYIPVGLILLWNKAGWPRWKELVAGAVSATIVFLPQMFFWKLIYGELLLIPQGGNYMQWGSPELEAVLFSSRHGLLSWSPVLWVGVLGFFGFCRRAPVFGGALLAGFLAAWYINGSVSDWWAGASFGARRFDGALPAFGLGIAAAVTWMESWTRKHVLGVVFFLLVPFLAWNAGLIGVYALGGIPYDGPVSFKQVGSDAIELVHQRFGYPFSWPGALAERTRSGLPVASYDLAGALHPSNNVEIRMGDTDALYLGPGWSLPRRGTGRTFREGSSSGATLFVALNDRVPYQMSILGETEGSVEVFLNATSIDTFELDGRPSVEIRVPAGSLVSGMNEIRFRPAENKPFSVSRVVLRRSATH